MTTPHRQDWLPQGIDYLEPNAWKALREIGKSVLVTAGAGTGKTEFLAQKATFLLQTGICPSPQRILAISFKTDAARNLAERVTQRCSSEQARRFDSLTFDAFTKNLLDRFVKAIPHPWQPTKNYRIIIRKEDYQNFSDSHEIQGFDLMQLESFLKTSTLPLPEEIDENTHAIAEFWEEMNHVAKETHLSFLMINRLVHCLIRANDYIKLALQLTYPYIFLDEFQDTTYPQFELLNTAFQTGPAKLTAVGDDKQRIMVWAGAMPDSFNQFLKHYSARRFSLNLNWRSHEELVAIQNVIAQELDSNVEPQIARGRKQVSGNIAAVWNFSDAESESNVLAAWLASEFRPGILEPHQVAVLVRKEADSVEDNLSQAFSAHKLCLRNLARIVDKISIQDLLVEDLTKLILPVLRLGISDKSPDSWHVTQRNLHYVFNVNHDDEATNLRMRFQDVLLNLRSRMQEKELSTDAVQKCTTLIKDFWTEEHIRQAFPAYRRQPDFDRAWNGLLALMKECTDLADSWTEVLDKFEGKGQVPLMTIHKGKGLGFNTMIFYGLDNKTWWSLNRGNKEELNVFYVAFTRAEQRAFFTMCKERGDSILWLEELLEPAGVKRIEGNKLLEN